MEFKISYEVIKYLKIFRWKLINTALAPVDLKTKKFE